MAKYTGFFARASIYTATVIRFLLNILVFVIVAALMVGVYKSGYDLIHSLHRPLEYILQQMLLDIVFIAALVELSITVLGYLKDGRVHVRYIIDTIFIIMLNEIVSLWFKKPSFAQVGALCLTVAVLAIIRISVVKFDFKNGD
jgi:uncharacterized membrane protein (DUF373 family)